MLLRGMTPLKSLHGVCLHGGTAFLLTEIMHSGFARRVRNENNNEGKVNESYTASN
jgi:hypothetical protein